MEAVRKNKFFTSQEGLGTLGANIGVGTTTAIFEAVADEDECYVGKDKNGKADIRPASDLERLNAGAVGYTIERKGKSSIDVVFVKVNGKICRATSFCQSYEIADEKGVKTSYHSAMTGAELETLTDKVTATKPQKFDTVGADYVLPNTDDIKLRVAIGAKK